MKFNLDVYYIMETELTVSPTTTLEWQKSKKIVDKYNVAKTTEKVTIHDPREMYYSLFKNIYPKKEFKHDLETFKTEFHNYIDMNKNKGFIYTILNCFLSLWWVYLTVILTARV
jgi:hypothetical protein